MEGTILCMSLVTLLSIDGSIAAGEEGSKSHRGKSKSLALAFKEENAENEAKVAFDIIAKGNDHITKDDMTSLYKVLNDDRMTANAVKKIFKEKGKDVLTLKDFEEMFKDLPLHMDRLVEDYKKRIGYNKNPDFNSAEP